MSAEAKETFPDPDGDTAPCCLSHAWSTVCGQLRQGKPIIGGIGTESANHSIVLQDVYGNEASCVDIRR